MKVKKYIQGRIMLQKLVFLILIGILAVSALVLDVLMYSTYAGYLFGLKDISTNAQIERFYNSSFQASNLHFDNAIETDLSIDIETTQSHSVTFMNPALGFMAPLELPANTTSVTTYHLFLLENEDSLTVLCSKTPNVDFSQNVVSVRNDYKDINYKIIDAFSDSTKPVYVFYTSGGANGGVGLTTPAIFAFLVAVFCIIAYFKPIRKASRLGKQICKLGDYDNMVAELNRQVAEAAYKSSTLIICADYLILEKNTNHRQIVDIVPIKDIVSVSSVPDEKYPYEIIEMTINTSPESGNNTYVFKVYDIDAEQMLLDLSV